MSIPLSSIMATFSFTNVENWRTVNFLPKCTRLHQIASQISKFSRGLAPGRPSLWKGDTPSPNPCLARRFAPRLVAFGHSIVPSDSFILPPETNGWVKPKHELGNVRTLSTLPTLLPRRCPPYLIPSPPTPFTTFLISFSLTTPFPPLVFLARPSNPVGFRGANPVHGLLSGV